MPIQIRELIVTATVEDQRPVVQVPLPKGEVEAQKMEASREMVQTCVEEVLKVIKQQGRR